MKFDEAKESQSASASQTTTSESDICQQDIKDEKNKL